VSPRAPADVLSGREAACDAVLAAARGQGYARDVIASLRGAGRLAARESAFATEAALGTMRRLVTIDHVLGAVAQIDARRTPEVVRAILRVATCQAIWLDRTPVFAAVDEAVSLARRRAGRGPARLVNAVLRRLSGAIEQRRAPWQRGDPCCVRVDWDRACRFRAPVLPSPDDDPAQHVAAAAGESPEHYRRLTASFGAAQAEAIAWARQATPPLVLHRNPQVLSGEQFYAAIAAQFAPDAEWGMDTAFARRAAPAAESDLLATGGAWAQDVAAREAAELVAARPGERVLDLCAAPGGKTIALATRMRNAGELIACDVAAARLSKLAENVARLRLTIVKPALIPVDGLPEALVPGEFDAVLVDAPCSNSGVFARRPEARLRLDVNRLAPLLELQRALLERGAARVRSGGRLVYSTCSLEPEENESRVAAFLKRASGWKLEAADTFLPSWGPNLSDYRDGGFAARLRRAR